jgi:hypothetical protein
LIPYFQQPSLHLFGPVTIHAFGFLVAVAVIVGSKLAIMRCERRKMDPDVCAELIFCALVTGFLVAHVYAILAYFPRQAIEDPLLLLHVPARFGLDFLRLSDARYFGLTPGQYAGFAVFVAALYALRWNAAVPRSRSG